MLFLQALVFHYHMIQWKAIEADVSPQDLNEVLAGLPLLDAIAAMQFLSRGPLILFATEAQQTIYSHVCQRREESGGSQPRRILQRDRPRYATPLLPS
jgi:hypothetical protein